MAADARFWIRTVIQFGIGLALFILMISVWGHEGVNTGRMIVMAVLLVVGAFLIALLLLAWRRRKRHGGSDAIVRLLREGRVDEAVKQGRDLFEKTPDNPHVAWYYIAALMGSGHLAEARRVFATLKPEKLPPRMAAMHGDVKEALEKRTQT